MEFYNKTGKVALGSRLRLLTDKIAEDASQIYKLYNVELIPKWFPVFRTLEQGDAGITEIAQQIGHSHPSVSKIVSEMISAGIVKQKPSKTDGRKSIAGLSSKGKKISEKLAIQCLDVDAAVEEVLNQTRNDLWQAIGEWEYLLDQKSLLRRVVERKKQRESLAVRIIPYTPKYKKAFRTLNEEWISKYFAMEATDFKALDDPNGYILKKAAGYS